MEQRKAHRVVFEKGFTANMMAIDGTWRRPCTMMDVSDTGARLSIDGSIEDLAMAEFFLVLSSMGKAYRRHPAKKDRLFAGAEPSRRTQSLGKAQRFNGESVRGKRGIHQCGGSALVVDRRKDRGN